MIKKITKLLLFIILAFFIKAIDTVFLLDKMRTLRFYIELAQITVTILSCTYLVKKISGILDERIQWNKFPIKRLFIQLFLTITLSIIVIYILFIPISIFLINESVFKVLEPIHLFYAIILILLFNLFYSWRHISELLQKINRDNQQEGSDFIVVNSGSKSFPIPFNRIVEIFIENKTVFLLDSENKTFVMPKTIEQYYKILPGSIFYRLNRQIIANKVLIRHFENIENRKLKVVYGIKGYEKEAIISQKKVTHFKKWFSSESE